MFLLNLCILFERESERRYCRARTQSRLHWFFHGRVFFLLKISRSSFCYIKVRQFCCEFSAIRITLNVCNRVVLCQYSIWHERCICLSRFLYWTDSGILWIKQLILVICVLSWNIHLTPHNFPLSQVDLSCKGWSKCFAIFKILNLSKLM